MSRKEIITNFVENGYYGEKEKVIKRLLKEEGQYIIDVYWGSGNQIHMGTKQQLIDAICEKANSSYDDAFDLLVWGYRNK